MLKLSVKDQASELPTADRGGDVRYGLYSPWNIVSLGPSKFKLFKKKPIFADRETISSRKGGRVWDVLKTK